MNNKWTKRPTKSGIYLGQYKDGYDLIYIYYGQRQWWISDYPSSRASEPFELDGAIKYLFLSKS